jgi:hypothetical protein
MFHVEYYGILQSFALSLFYFCLMYVCPKNIYSAAVLVICALHLVRRC